MQLVAHLHDTLRRLLAGRRGLVGATLALAAACGGPPPPSDVDGEAALALDNGALLAHVRPTAEHPATLINFWATW